VNWFNPWKREWWTRRIDWRDELVAAVLIGCEMFWLAWMGS